MRGDVEPFERRARVTEQIQRPRGGDARVELAEASTGGVARIHELRLATLDLLGVDLREALLREDDFAADLEPRGQRPALGGGAQPQGDAAHRLQVRADVLAGRAITASRALRKDSALVDELDGDAVELVLRDVLDRALVVEKAANARLELLDLLTTHGVVERQHRHGVAHLSEALARRGAHPLRR